MHYALVCECTLYKVLTGIEGKKGNQPYTPTTWKWPNQLKITQTIITGIIMASYLLLGDSSQSVFEESYSK